MIVNTITIDGVDRVVWDSARGVIEYAVDGTTETGVRQFTPAEQVFATDVVNTTARNNAATLQGQASASIDTMLQGITQVQEFAAGTLVTDAQINANPALYMRLVAAELVEVEQNLIAIVRVQTGQTDSTDTGG